MATQSKHLGGRTLPLAVLIVAGLLSIAGCGGGGGGSADPAPAPAPALSATQSSSVVLTTGPLQASTLSTQTVGTGGGSITVTASADPLLGLKIDVPAGAATESVKFVVSSAAVSAATGLPTGASLKSRLIRIETTGSEQWNQEKAFTLPVTITLPPSSAGEALNVFKLEAGDKLEPMGLYRPDRTTILKFQTRAPGSGALLVPAADSRPGVKSAASIKAYAEYVVAGIVAEFFTPSVGRSVDTGFKVDLDGWFIPNYGSYYRQSQGGNCLGMVSLAKYYFRERYRGKLWNGYRDPAPTQTWVDDATAIELASRAHNAMSDIWRAKGRNDEQAIQVSSSQNVARSLVGAMRVTNDPALMAIYRTLEDGVRTGHHAIMVHRADITSSGDITFFVYDPNFPGDTARRIFYTSAEGFKQYESGTTTSGGRFLYNDFEHVGFSLGLTTDLIADLKKAADGNFADGSVFPKIVLTRMVEANTGNSILNTTATTTQGQPRYVTADTAILIEGTVLGGEAQLAGSVVDKISIIAPSGRIEAAVDNRAGGGSGKFSATVPVFSGINQIALLAKKSGAQLNWAAFKEILVDSTATPSAFSANLTWTIDKSDVDLYVQEPNGASPSQVGDIVYYGHRKGTSQANPYLDLDNTAGFGPEHYIARNGMVTKYANGTSASGILGTYRLGVHYYADRSGASSAQPAGWTVKWRYLKACDAPCPDVETKGVWAEGQKSGVIGTALSSAEGPAGFAAGGSSWSERWEVLYPAPETVVTIPPSIRIMLP